MSDRYRPGALSWDMGIGSGDGALVFDVTTEGIAVVVGGHLLGFVSANELRAVADGADYRCPTCGQPKGVLSRPDGAIRGL